VDLNIALIIINLETLQPFLNIVDSRAENRMKRKREYLAAMRRGEQPVENPEPHQRSSSREGESASSRHRRENATKLALAFTLEIQRG
jgi:hypothetical protein